MAVDFLSSDIVFPSDSNEPKLSMGMTKLPEPVDWGFHDYYSTACEKSFNPLQSLTDLRKLEPVTEDKASTKQHLVTLQEKLTPQQQQSLVFALSTKSRPLPPTVPEPNDPQKDLRAALRGALEVVGNDLQDNHLSRLSTRPVGKSKQSDDWTWKDDLLHGSLGNNFFGDASNANTSWRNAFAEDDFDLNYADHRIPSPAYQSINENPVLLDSSVITSHISSSIIHENDYAAPPEEQMPHIRLSPPPLPVNPKPAQKKTKQGVWQGVLSKLKKPFQNAQDPPPEESEVRPRAKPVPRLRFRRFFQTNQR